MTINGQIINKPHPKVITEINFKIMQLYDKEDRELNYDEIQKQLSEDPKKYIEELNLDKEYLDLIKDSFQIKLAEGVEYVPAITVGGETEFNLNIGKTLFRNNQEEFKDGLLSPYTRKFNYFNIKAEDDAVLDEKEDLREYHNGLFKDESPLYSD